MQVVLKSKNKDEFRSIVEQLNAVDISILETRTPGYFSYGKSAPANRFFLFIVVIIGIILGIFLIVFINSVWVHQVGNKPQNLSGVIGWLPVIFEVTVLFTAIIYLIRFIFGLSKREKELMELNDPMHYYCFLELKNDKEKELVFTNFEKHQIIVC